MPLNLETSMPTMDDDRPKLFLFEQQSLARIQDATSKRDDLTKRRSRMDQAIEAQEKIISSLIAEHHQKFPGQTEMEAIRHYQETATNQRIERAKVNENLARIGAIPPINSLSRVGPSPLDQSMAAKKVVGGRRQNPLNYGQSNYRR